MDHLPISPKHEPKPSALHLAVMSLVWGTGSILLAFLGAWISTLLAVSVDQWPFAWLFEIPAALAAIQALKRGYAAHSQAIMQREQTLSETGLVVGYFACIVVVVAVVSIPLFILATPCRLSGHGCFL